MSELPPDIEFVYRLGQRDTAACRSLSGVMSIEQKTLCTGYLFALLDKKPVISERRAIVLGLHYLGEEVKV